MTAWLAYLPQLADGGARPGDTRASLIALTWCLGSLVVAGVAWAVLRRLHDRRVRRRDDRSGESRGRGDDPRDMAAEPRERPFALPGDQKSAPPGDQA